MITLPDPIYELSEILIGAISEELDPIKAFLPMMVLYFSTPSKLHVIVPAPILVPDPKLASPIYDR